MSKIERKYLAHWIDTSFGDGTASYVRIGKDLEEYNEELNPDVEVTRNILGEQNVLHNGYEVQSEVTPFYYYDDDALATKLAAIANGRKTGDDCKTTKVDVLFSASAGTGGTITFTQIWAYREEVYVVPNSVGGDTTGVQIPFTIYNAGNRVAGTWDFTNNSFTASN